MKATGDSVNVRLPFALLLSFVLLAVTPARAALFTSKADYTGDWAAAGTWTNEAVPGNGDDVEIVSAGSVVILSSPSSNLNSVAIGKTLTFTNWNSALQATTLTVQATGIINLPPAFTNNAQSNNVYVICTDMSIAPGGSIDASYKGYAGGSGAAYNGNGPGGGQGWDGANYAAGAGHGGRGGWSYLSGTACRGGEPYGSVTNPAAPGSGGGGCNGSSAGGAGGGAVRIQASGHVAVNGTIAANGANASSPAGGGAGGSIWIDCNTFAATNGVMQAWGGNRGYYPAGGGGGGRIAINYSPAAQAALAKPSVRFIATSGFTWYEDLLGNGYRLWDRVSLPAGSDIGTLAFPDNALLDTANINHIGQWIVPGMTGLACDTFNISDGWIRFPYEGFTLTVTNNMTISGGALVNGILDLGATVTTNVFSLGGFMTNNMTIYTDKLRYGFICFTNGPSVNVGGNLIVTNSGQIFLGHALNSLPGADYGALLSVTGTMYIAANSWIYPYCQTTNGMAPLLRMSNLVIAASGGINADWSGFIGGFDPSSTIGRGPGGSKGFANYSPGAGYGGRGGWSWNKQCYPGGAPYGSATNPALPGSGGGGATAAFTELGGSGGGLIRVAAAGQVVVNGTVTANGGNSSGIGGGGSGGGISIQCKTFAGTTGLIRANGGQPAVVNGGAGGGGRIAVNYDVISQASLPRPTVRCTAFPGTGAAEVYWSWVPQPYCTPEGADLGTIYFSDTSPLNESALSHRGQWIAPPGVTNLSLSTLVVTNTGSEGAWIRFPAEGFVLNVTNDIVITGSGSTLDFADSISSNNRTAYGRYDYMGLTAGPTLRCGGNLLLTNGAILKIESGATNAGTPSYGALVSVGSNMLISSNCWVYPRSNPTNGGSALLAMKDLWIAAGGGIGTNGLGYKGGDTVTNGFGPGRGGQGIVSYGSGAGYGGAGGRSSEQPLFGTNYGSELAPMDPGSGGGGNALNSDYGYGGYGGGLVRVVASGQITLNGSITANGRGYPFYNADGSYGGAGSGGAIYLTCRTFQGNAGASLSANGAAPARPANAGGGGGGRIAVWRRTGESNNVTCVAAGGAGYVSGTAGTIYWGIIPPPGTVIKLW